MNSIKSLFIVSVSLLMIIVAIFFYTYFRFTALEERINHLEQKIEKPETRIIPSK